jgi:hypothetical protein
MAQTDGQQPILYVEDGSMTVLPAGAPPVRYLSSTSHNSKSKTEGIIAEKEGLAYETEVPSTGDNDAGNVMAALEKQEKAPFPEGGKAAWLTVLGTFCCTMVTFGVLNTYGVSSNSGATIHCREAETMPRYTKPTSSKHTSRAIQILPSTGLVRSNMLASLVLGSPWVSSAFPEAASRHLG